MTRVEPDRVEYCRLNGDVLNAFSYPYGHEINADYCLALAQQCLSSYWHNDGRALQRMMKIKPYPELVRVVAGDGEEICRWSVDDEQRRILRAQPG